MVAAYPQIQKHTSKHITLQFKNTVTRRHLKVGLHITGIIFINN